MAFRYINPNVPDGYKCGTCGAHGCKLWRLYQTFLENQKLYCCMCAGADQKHAVDDIDAQGRTPTEPGSRQRHDSIGWLVPAVPTEDNETYWGYSSVPDAGVAWWRALPTRAP